MLTLEFLNRKWTSLTDSHEWREVQRRKSLKLRTSNLFVCEVYFFLCIATLMYARVVLGDDDSRIHEWLEFLSRRLYLTSREGNYSHRQDIYSHALETHRHCCFAWKWWSLSCRRRKIMAKNADIFCQIEDNSFHLRNFFQVVCLSLSLIVRKKLTELCSCEHRCSLSFLFTFFLFKWLSLRERFLELTMVNKSCLPTDQVSLLALYSWWGQFASGIQRRIYSLTIRSVLKTSRVWTSLEIDVDSLSVRTTKRLTWQKLSLSKGYSRYFIIKKVMSLWRDDHA